MESLLITALRYRATMCRFTVRHSYRTVGTLGATLPSYFHPIGGTFKKKKKKKKVQSVFVQLKAAAERFPALFI